MCLETKQKKRGLFSRISREYFRVSPGIRTGHDESEKNIVYKIGDFGHVIRFGDPLVEDGDSRYLALEVMQEKKQCLAKADVFSLALTVYVAVSITHGEFQSEKWKRSQ